MTKKTGGSETGIRDTIIFLCSFLNKLFFLTIGTLHYVLVSTKRLVKSKNDARSLKDIPGPYSIPFFGTMLSDSAAGGTDLKATNEYLAKRYGPITKLEHYWNFPIVIVQDANDIQKVVKVQHHLRPPMEIVVLQRKSRPDIYSRVGIVNALDKNEHKLLRGGISNVYSPPFVLTCIPNVDEIVTDFINMVRDIKNGRIENFEDWILRLSLENSLSLVLNKRMGLLTRKPLDNNEMAIFFQCSHKYFEALHVSMYGFPKWKYFPSNVWNQFDENENKMHSIFSEIVQNEIKNKTSSGLLKSILDTPDLTFNDQTALARDMVLAGSDPIKNTLLNVLFQISAHPEVDQKLFEELKKVLPRKDSHFNESCLSQVPYLKACIQEAFRICPTTPNLARILETDIQLQDYKIPAYTLIICQHWHACLQESNFYKAKDYIPERWLINHESEQRSTIFTPHTPRLLYHFGFGRRDCPGKRFAFQEICILTSKILRNFQLRFERDPKFVYSFLLVPRINDPVLVSERPE